MRITLLIAFLCGLCGFTLLLTAFGMPYYKDISAPERLSQEILEGSGPGSFKEWHDEIKKVETPKKRRADLGRGLITAGFCLLAAAVCLSFYDRYRNVRNLSTILLLWLGIWVVQFPLTIWYYGIRHERFDYPTWGDAIAIPIVQEIFVLIVGLILSTPLLCLLMIRHPFKKRLRFMWPVSAWGWFRATIIVAWLLIEVVSTIEGVINGDEGRTLFGIATSAILLIYLRTRETEPKLVEDELAS